MDEGATRREAYLLRRPARQLAPVVVSSPHSGRDYPAGFLRASRLDPLALRSSEDAFVDRLFSDAPALGVPLLCARAPRAYIDLNRAPDELDPAVIDGVAPVHGNPRIASGLGVIPGVVAGGQRIYREKLSRGEARERIRRFWNPWHRRLGALLAETHARFGMVLLLDCHSMPHAAIESRTRGGGPRPDIVLGDRFGASAGEAETARVEAALGAAGLRVARNAPFAGAHIARAYGRPSHGVHVVQLEIDRALYMDEARIVPHPDFEAARQRLCGVLAAIIAGFRDDGLRNDGRMAAE